ncbi:MULTISPECIES: hypothetical protein [Lacticaseibacillus]|uniref:DUF4115 domain-containing protein n=2 Tax=Lacticaseibacillus TaxID=2759736 RepID=A0AAN1EZ97_LACCA|nr:MULTISPECIES: hypothetical protein [Lacticaseibacillus]ARY91876.1 hypothetical protein BGL52_08985 [Lacticaseibacillus casei]KAB1970923.1 hypothetical protein F9B82_00070 [Lacticaseibacillus casei]WLV79778.1 hypothetical protein LACSTY_001808 [Lacticaseibacillus sp. NCIMB 15473]WNX23738.1 hypothetical protein RWA15_08750 [Lacticaseibacillus casei]WNX26513.1 hypothetical protein RWA16_08755 [Lacticaseibacillus casei]
MKKWMMIAAALVTLGGLSGAAFYQHQVSAKSEVRTADTETTSTKASTRQSLTSQASVQVSTPASESETNVTTSAKTDVTTTTASTATDAVNSSSAAASSATSQPTVKAPFYIGTWHNEHVTLTITGDQMTITQAGANTTSGYTAAQQGNGMILTPTDVAADPIYLVPVNGGLQWVAPGATTPLILRP